MKPPEIRRQQVTVSGAVVTIRPIRGADKEIELAFLRDLSADSKYFRFYAPIKEFTPELLDSFVNVDAPHEMAFVATSPAAEGEREIGVARYALDEDRGVTEFAVVVADAWQGQGIGRELKSHDPRVSSGWRVSCSDRTAR